MTNRFPSCADCQLNPCVEARPESYLTMNVEACLQQPEISSPGVTLETRSSPAIPMTICAAYDFLCAAGLGASLALKRHAE